MDTKRLKPFVAMPPGRLVVLELEARDWTVETLAGYSGLTVETVDGIIHGSKSITSEVAAGLSAAFGTSRELWENMQSNYDQDRSDNRSSA